MEELKLYFPRFVDFRHPNEIDRVANRQELVMTQEDLASLDKLKTTHNLIKDGVHQVVEGFATGLFISGEGGTGKSYIVKQELDRLVGEAGYKFHNTKIYPRHLVNVLMDHDSHIHWLEDCEDDLLNNKDTFGVLRSALFSQSKAHPMVRPIHWGSSRGPIDFNFYGGIIIISNINMADRPELRAIKQRLQSINVVLDEAQVAALSKQICQNGFTFGQWSMEDVECWEVAKFLKQCYALLNRPPDLRLLEMGFKAYLFWREKESHEHWKTIVENSMRNSASPRYKSQKEIKAEEAMIAMEIDALKDAKGKKLPIAQKLAKWREVTGLNSQRSYYQALKRMK